MYIYIYIYKYIHIQAQVGGGHQDTAHHVQHDDGYPSGRHAGARLMEGS